MAKKRSMLGILLHEHIQSEVIQAWSGVKDVIVQFWKEKFPWSNKLQGLETTGGPMQVLTAIRETGIDHLEISTINGRRNWRVIRSNMEKKGKGQEASFVEASNNKEKKIKTCTSMISSFCFLCIKYSLILSSGFLAWCICRSLQMY